MTTFDAIIVGAGQAGPSLAGRLTGAGMRVALVERKLLGGTCVNTGCMPTKTLVASARAAHVARHAERWGVFHDGAVRVDMARVAARPRKVTEDARAGLAQWLGAMPGLALIEGHARLDGHGVVRVGAERLTAPRIFLNVGGRAAVPPLPGVDRIRYLTNTSILSLDTLPRHLVVVGGSYIGLEFAQMYRRFGADVTVVEKGPRLIPREDEDVSEAIAGIFAAEGVAIRTRAECIGFEPSEGGGAMVRVDCEAGAPEVPGSHVLLATGRRPNTDDLGLETAGVARDERGFITADDAPATTAPGICALGDCNGRGAFTHTSYNDFEIVTANLLDGADRRVSARVMLAASATARPVVSASGQGSFGQHMASCSI